MQKTAVLQKQKLNISDQIAGIIKEIVVRSENFSHIRPDNLLVCIGTNKNKGRGYIYGKLVPLKFQGGSDIRKYKDRYYKIPTITSNGFQILYAIYFYFPKFFDLSLLEKINVIFHELYHISPDFNGDIREMGERKKAHGFSKKTFNARFENEVNIFYEYILTTGYYKFLNMNTKMLHENFIIFARRMKIPKPVLLKNYNNEIFQRMA